MTSEDWARIKGALLEALKLPLADREGYLRSRLDDEPLLLKEALSLAGEMAPEEEPDGSAPVLRTLGDYTITEELGRGGVGIVFRAQHPSLGRDVALKVLGLSASADGKQVDRFRREARAAGQLNHPAIVHVNDVGQANGEWYIASELIEGHDLATEIQLQSENTGRERWLMPPHEERTYAPAAAKLVMHVAEGLQVAHTARIVHRDVKPHNLLLDKEGNVKLTDFGLAKDESLGSITHTGQVEGTPYYMSPEQVRGVRNKVDQRTDVYSLGVVLYELLTFHRPFEGKTSAQVIQKIAKHDPKQIRRLNPRVPADLALICEKAMQRVPQERYQSAGAFAEDLSRFLNHEAVSAKGASLALRSLRHLQRRRVGYLSAATISLAILGGASVADRVAAAESRGQISASAQQVLASSTQLEALGRQLPALREALLRQVEDQRSSAEEVRLSNQALAVIETYAQDLVRSGESLIQQGTQPDGLTARAPSETRFHLGLERLATAARLRPDDVDLQLASKAVTYRPTLHIQGFHDGGPAPKILRVTLQEVLGDGTLGPIEELNTDDPAGSALIPGLYRITCFGAEGYGEFSRTIRQRGRTYSMLSTIIPTPDVTAGMIFIPAGDAVVGSTVPMPGGTPPWDKERTVTLPAYWIDATEVTNGQFRRFVESGEGPTPPYWTIFPEELRPSNWDDLPVFGVPYGDAQAYAHWAGRRLPTRLEWEVAAGGRTGFKYPWGDEPAIVEGMARVNMPPGPKLTPTLDLPSLRGYSSGVATVGTTPTDLSPFGLYDCLGNVREWTETPAQSRLADWPGIATTPHLDYGMRIVLGSAWNAPLNRGLKLVGIATMQANTLGFRCAKSHF